MRTIVIGSLCVSLSAWAGGGHGSRSAGAHQGNGSGAAHGQTAQGAGGFAEGGGYIGNTWVSGERIRRGFIGNSPSPVPGGYARGVVRQPVYPVYPYPSYPQLYGAPIPYGSSAYGFTNPAPSEPPPAQPEVYQEPQPAPPQVVVQPIVVTVPAAPLPAPAPPAPVVAAPLPPPEPPAPPPPSTGKGPDIFHWVDENGVENYSTSVPASARGKAKKVNAELGEVTSSVVRKER